ncbi:putative intracellular protease/amidase [Nocardioides sp. BE266]|uniref:DJ-1/PfpI family protein n=1 Tax=Nocardioides sp. BE266 TaxID=2817725 RepID=UPI002860140F|nr:DJ-1/PfpI family protein [Nocardioides sp. BE266]MDR7255161.1 putative intracellular protease/amidase [Nocardioides sp. BE266]
MRLAAPAATAVRVAGSVLLAAATLGVIGFAGARTTASQSRLPTTRMSHPLPAPAIAPTRDRLVVAVVLGTSGTVATDAMGPFEVFGRSSRFTVYTVAERRSPALVEGAPSILPDHTFAEVDANADLAPDVVVVPAVTDPTVEVVARDWVVRQHDAGAHVLSVCAGALLLAETGLLDGRTATSHWSRLAWLRGHHPETRWVSGERFVRDGRITTTAGITSGIPGALSVVEDLSGPAEARRVGAEVGYPGWSPEATKIPVQHWSLADHPVVLNTALPWGRPTVAITLADGVGEIDAASLFEVYGVSAAARTFAVSRTGILESAHGLRLLTLTPGEAPDVDVVLRPGVTGPSGRAGFDGALEQLARTSGAATARSAAKMIDYPTEQLDLGSARGPRRASLLAGASLVLALLVGAVPVVRRRRQPLAGFSGAPASPS